MAANRRWRAWRQRHKNRKKARIVAMLFVIRRLPCAFCAFLRQGFLCLSCMSSGAVLLVAHRPSVELSPPQKIRKIDLFHLTFMCLCDILLCEIYAVLLRSAIRNPKSAMKEGGVGVSSSEGDAEVATCYSNASYVNCSISTMMSEG